MSNDVQDLSKRVDHLDQRVADLEIAVQVKTSEDKADHRYIGLRISTLESKVDDLVKNLDDKIERVVSGVDNLVHWSTNHEVKEFADNAENAKKMNNRLLGVIASIFLLALSMVMDWI